MKCLYLLPVVVLLAFPSTGHAQTTDCSSKKDRDPDCWIGYFTKEIQANPTRALSYNQRGLTYLEKKNEDLAMRDFTKAIEVEPSFDSAYSNRGHIYLRRGNFDAAIKDFGKAIEVKPDSFYAWGYRADAYFEHHDYELAIKDYTKVNDLIGLDYDSYARCAWSYLYLRNPKGAFTEVLHFMDTAEDDNDEIPYMFLVGHLALREADYKDDAGEFLSSALKLVEPKAWTSNIMRYLIGQLTDSQLLALADNSDKKVEANAYIGMNESLLGHRESALKYLRLVVASGKKSFYEYSLAELEIRRLEIAPAGK